MVVRSYAAEADLRTDLLLSCLVQLLMNIKHPMRGGCPVLLELKIVRISSETLIQLRESINNAVMVIDEMVLQNVWNELNFSLDICRVTQGAHIELL